MSRPASLLLLALFPLALPAAAPPSTSPTAHGDRLRDAYFRRQAKQLGDAALADIRTRADWERKRPELHRQFLDMMGLWPLPPRSDLKATLTGKTDTPHFTVENLHYQSSPGLYVSANLYVPKHRKGPCPAVLYVCGHGPTVIDKVPYGNKVTYQHHPAWFAENGYVCLIVDTLQLGELPGLHHGTHHLGMWWWLSLGYTPAGVELWNAMRGIDYLVSRPEVDPRRIGVTGRSGGGATSWWVGAADERVRCIIPVAGIADLLAHVSEGYPGRLKDGVVAGHCDCMYMLNTYRWDYTMVMALCAPRPLMLGNSDVDQIFPIPGYRRMSDKVKKLYELLGAGDRFTLLETRGPHKDTPELRLGAFRWMNRWLKDDNSDVSEPERPRLVPKQLKVFARPPADAINDIVHERFRRPARLELPAGAEVAREWWKGQAPPLRKALLERCFRGWPEKVPDLAVQSAGERSYQGVRVRGFDYVSEEGVPLRLWLVQRSGANRPQEVVACVLDEAGWGQWLRELGPAFRDVLHAGGNPAPSPYPKWEKDYFARLGAMLQGGKRAYALITPRGVGRTRWSELNRFDRRPDGQHIRRRFYLLGQTLEGQQVWDVRRAVACLQHVPDVNDVRLTLEGKGEMAGIALYAALFEPAVGALELYEPPTSHRQGPTFLSVLRVLDMPQAVALALPRKVRIWAKDEKEVAAWQWPVRLQKALGEGVVQVEKAGHAGK